MASAKPRLFSVQTLLLLLLTLAMRKYLFLAITLVSINIAFAQRGIQDPRLFIDSAVVFMDQANYEKADEYFMSALNEIDLLSADFCFYFGKNSFYLNKYAQSIDWLNKYLELKGSRGQFSEETLKLLEKAEEAFREDRSSANEGAKVNSKFFYLNTINCSQGSVITCPVCKGQGVIITLDRFGEKLYRTCPYSTNGVLTCGEYNLLIQGKLQPKKN